MNALLAIFNPSAYKELVIAVEKEKTSRHLAEITEKERSATRHQELVMRMAELGYEQKLDKVEDDDGDMVYDTVWVKSGASTDSVKWGK